MDDLANGWGTTLVLDSDRCSRSKKEKLRCHSDGGFSLLKQAVSLTLDRQFGLLKATTCGSDANAFAMLASASNGSFGTIGTAAGSYVSGTNCGLQNWSTSNFELQYGPATVTHAQFVSTDFTKHHTIALPYHIPGAMEQEALERYEDDCLQAFHRRLLEGRLHNRALKTLLMELVLGGCGASLSDRALMKIAALSEEHDFSITVDEILTGGRDGVMLMVSKKPERFRKRVRFITMGKIFGGGLILASKEEMQAAITRDDPDQTSVRGPSNVFDCTTILAKWKEVAEKLDLSDERRAYVLDSIKLPEADAWGPGAMIYGPVHRHDLGLGLKNRFLPMLDSVPVAKFKITRRDDWTKEKVNAAVVAGVLSWVTHVASVTGDKDTDRVTRLLLQRLARPADVGSDQEMIAKVDVEQWCPGEQNTSLVKSIARDAKKFGLMKCPRKGTARVETYIIEGKAKAPWVRNPNWLQASPASVAVRPRHDFVGDRVAKLHSTGKVQFGKVNTYNRVGEGGENDTWVIRFDRRLSKGKLLVESVGLSELQQMISDYAVHEDNDGFLGRYNGDRVVKIRNGTDLVFGIVVDGSATDAADMFLVQYDGGEESQEWVTSYEVHMMRSWFKKHQRETQPDSA